MVIAALFRGGATKRSASRAGEKRSKPLTRTTTLRVPCTSAIRSPMRASPRAWILLLVVLAVSCGGETKTEVEPPPPVCRNLSHDICFSGAAWRCSTTATCEQTAGTALDCHDLRFEACAPRDSFPCQLDSDCGAGFECGVPAHCTCQEDSAKLVLAEADAFAFYGLLCGYTTTGGPWACEDPDTSDWIWLASLAFEGWNQLFRNQCTVAEAYLELGPQPLMAAAEAGQTQPYVSPQQFVDFLKEFQQDQSLMPPLAERSVLVEHGLMEVPQPIENPWFNLDHVEDAVTLVATAQDQGCCEQASERRCQVAPEPCTEDADCTQGRQCRPTMFTPSETGCVESDLRCLPRQWSPTDGFP